MSFDPWARILNPAITSWNILELVIASQPRDHVFGACDLVLVHSASYGLVWVNLHLETSWNDGIPS